MVGNRKWSIYNCNMVDRNETAAYGGRGWSPRHTELRAEIGNLWAACGINSEWAPLRRVLLHRPGPEMLGLPSPDQVQMLAPVDANVLQSQHDALKEAYTAAGVQVDYVLPHKVPPPNQMFVADLMVMTPEGAIVGRPASTVRAGEERFVARRLADLGIPILRTVGGRGVFEGADAMWLRPERVLLGIGLRTNQEGARQVKTTFNELGVKVTTIPLGAGTMHLMGILRIVSPELAVIWPGRLPAAGLAALEACGYQVLALPDEREVRENSALNFVTLGPAHLVMSAANPHTQTTLEAAGIRCETVDTSELIKAAGGIGCLSGVLERDTIPT